MSFGSLKNLVILTVFIALCSCSTSRVKVNYNDEVDFLDFKTFAWLEPMKKDKKSYISLSDQSVRKMINEALKLKGLKEAQASKADVFITTNLTEKEKVSYNSNPAFFNSNPAFFHSYYRPYWGYSTHWSAGPDYYTESTFVLAFVDPKTKHSLWEGYAKDSSFSSMSETEVQKIVDAFFNYFPPLPTPDFEGYDKLEDVK
ncbi:MAG: DUF4136 domain-containing protein [Lentisphaeraceae bacterium]|nr:DUF4136 domain-containing protein [Lentisphaeraceae bacterium]